MTTHTAPAELMADIDRLTRDGFTLVAAPRDTGGDNYVATLRRDNRIASVSNDGTAMATILGLTDTPDEYGDGIVNGDDWEHPVITIDGRVYELAWLTTTN